eukprot:scaffold6091_cov164-Amphora_coffeaeformis.AAC.4
MAATVSEDPGYSFIVMEDGAFHLSCFWILLGAWDGELPVARWENYALFLAHDHNHDSGWRGFKYFSKKGLSNFE